MQKTIDEKLHCYDQILGRRRLWGLRWMLSPRNESWLYWTGFLPQGGGGRGRPPEEILPLQV